MLLLHRLWDGNRIHQQWRATLSCLRWQWRTAYYRPQLSRKMVSCQVSRGLTAKKVMQSNRWFKGPTFLWQEDPLPLQQTTAAYLRPAPVRHWSQKGSSIHVGQKNLQNQDLSHRIWNVITRSLQACLHAQSPQAMYRLSTESDWKA